MSPRRTCAAVAVIVAMLALAGVSGIGGSVRDQRDHLAAADAETVVRAVRVDGTAPRLTGAKVSEYLTAQRTFSVSLVLFAVLAALLWAASGSRRDLTGGPKARRAGRSYRSPISGRGPPFVRLSIA